MTSSYKAAIVGAGPIGAALALSLARVDQDAPILLLDSAPESPNYFPDKPDARIFAVNEGTRSLLDQLGVWQQIAAERCEPYKRMHVWDAQGTGSIEFDSDEIGAGHLGHIVEANLIQAKLLEAVASQPNIRFIRPEKVSAIELSSEQAELRLESGMELQAELLCAADGAMSSLRAMAQIDASEEDTGQQAIVANIFHERPNDGCAWQIFHPTGPLAFLPLADFEDKHLSSIVWSLDATEAEHIKQLSDADFEQALASAIEERFGKTSLASGRYSFPLIQRHAKTYVKNSFALVGDAAHSVHPLAGLGANIGFQDVAALSKELARGSTRGLSWGNLQLLKRYQRARRLDNELVLQSMKGFKQLFGQTSPGISAIRNLGLQGVDSLPGLKRRLVKQATMPG